MRNFLVVTLLLLAVRLDAGQDVWTPIGPEQGTITALAFSANGRTAYAATSEGGVFKSVNSGRSWSRTGGGPGGLVADLEADSTAPATVYAATFQGLFKTDDAGATWTDLTPRLPGPGGVKHAWSVTTSPAEPGTVYVGLWTGIYRSTDRGASWHAVAGLPRHGAVQVLAAHPRQRGALFAGTTDGLFRSNDSGRTWFRSGLRRSNVKQVAVDPLRPERVYAVRMIRQDHFPSYPEVFVSNQNGQGWRQVGTGVISGSGDTSLVVDPFVAGTAYLSVYSADGIYKTTDGGEHWVKARPVAFDEEGFSALAVNPRVPGMVLAGRIGLRDSPILRTLDGGASWAASGSGFRALHAREVVLDPEDPGTFYVLADCCSMWRTSDGGRTWRRISEGALPRSGIAALAVDPAVPTTLFVSAIGGVFKSLDRGETWSVILNSIGFVVEIAVDPAQPATLYAAAGYITPLKSLDSGHTWETLPTQEGLDVTEIAVAPGSSPVYTNGYFFDFSPEVEGYLDNIQRSMDGGATWTTVFSLGLKDGRITDLLVHPGEPDRALASFNVLGGPAFAPVSGGVLRSTGSGRWRRSSLSPESPPVFSLAQDPRDPARVYAGAPGAVFISRDHGATWTPMSAGLPPGDVVDLEVSPFDPATVYAATSGGLYVITQTSSH